jgi:glyoxylase-like metal-dependent hydrolase (beta-lactamase superfamily II)
MKLGDLEFHILNDGFFRLDGGAMFGVIPRPLWERVIPPDDRNRIRLRTNSLLIRTAGKLILVETGAGDKFDAKKRDIYAVEQAPRLPEQLAARGVQPEQVDVVVNTHLHFDHCGWNTRVTNGNLAPTFQNAQYIVQRGELEHARHASERDQASYFAENFEPMAKTGQWTLIDRDQEEIASGVELIRVPGHNRDMMCVRLTGGGQAAMLLADLVPTTAHLPLPWIMGFDLYPMETLANKKKWLPELVRGHWLAIFAHDPQVAAAWLRERDGKVVAEPVEVD